MDEYRTKLPTDQEAGRFWGKQKIETQGMEIQDRK